MLFGFDLLDLQQILNSVQYLMSQIYDFDILVFIF